MPTGKRDDLPVTKGAEIASNREKYPEIALFVDMLREVFGEVRVIKIVEKR